MYLLLIIHSLFIQFENFQIILKNVQIATNVFILLHHY